MPDSTAVDPAQIGPGLWGPLVFTVLLLATVLLLRSLIKQLKKVDAVLVEDAVLEEKPNQPSSPSAQQPASPGISVP